MNSFGRLLRRLRGKTSLSTVAERAHLDELYLVQVEEGDVAVDVATARQILQQGFGLNRPDTDRLILGIQLYDLGLKENDLRQLVIDLIRKETPPPIRTEIKQLYRRYAPE
jgi:transcriptional regulator with XRE-family HTH domain